MPYTQADIAEITVKKGEIRYRDPPAELVPSKGPDYNSAAWDRLYEWFDANTYRASDAILVFVCERSGVDLGRAYQITDSWAKRRHERAIQAEDPDYVPGHN